MSAIAAPEGLLDLSFAKDAKGRTALVRRSHRFPLQLTTPLYLDPERPDMPFVYVQNPTGGVFGGDKLTTRISAGAAASVHVTTTSATKVYRTENGGARQRTELTVGPRGYLEHVPEPLIPQAGCIYDQETVVDLEEGASAVLAEIVAPGRLARGECFAYHRLRLATTIRSCGVDVCRDVALLEPSTYSPARSGILGRRPYLGTLFAVAPSHDATELARRLDDELRSIAGAFGAAAVLPANAGAFVRVLGGSSESTRVAIDAAWGTARELLLGQRPPIRRRK